eukprot:436935_1
MYTSLQLLNNLITQIDTCEVNRLLTYLNKGIGCLDTRSLSICSECRLSNATVIEEQQLKDRLFELPMKSCGMSYNRHSQFILIPQSSQSRQILTQNGYYDFIEFNLNASDWQLLKTNCNKWVTQSKPTGIIQYIPLFQPCPLLKTHIDTIENSLFERYNETKKEGIIQLRCCDIGCGSGRDDIFLSLRNGHKRIEWNMDCVDYNEKMLQRLSQFARNANVTDRIRVIKAKIKGDNTINLYTDMSHQKPFLVHDLNSPKQHGNNEYFFEQEYDLILCFRFLERCIINKLWKAGQMMSSKGYLLIYTFMEGCEKIGRPKNPNFLLKKGELRELFSDESMFKIVVDKETKLEDGRPMQMFLCQKL